MSAISIDGLIKKMALLPEIAQREVQKKMKESAMQVRDTAVKKFGEYQAAEGDYSAWPELKPETVAAKEKAGGAEDPLIGHYDGKAKNKVWPQPLRNTVGTKVDGFAAAVGTDDPLGEWHEYGTEDGHIPPRPFLRPALYENQDNIKNNIKAGLENAIKAL